tara:strand:- start:434 stop:703 length:270 start_codon:yes stop_codon:yes gene_type:complete
MIDGLVFGIVDNGVLILGAFTGLSIEKYLPKRYQRGIGAVIGAGIGNTISDTLGAIVDTTMNDMILGITIGCLIPLITIPMIAKYRNIK